MKSLILIISLLIFSSLFFSCKRNPLKVDLSEIDTELEIVHFDDALFELDGKDTLKTWAEISNEHPDFFNLFTYRIIKIGGINDEDFSEFMTLFVRDSMMQDVRIKTEAVYGNRKKLENQLAKAFKYYAYHFPNKEIPKVFTYVSGFNQSVVTAENCIGISLDKYLGRDCEYYQQLNNIHQYKITNMHKNKILSDVAFAWGITEFEDPAKTTNLLGNMVEKGKLMYLVDAMLPDMPDSLKIGYTRQQLEWCQLNEPQMWTYLIEHEMLYSTKRMDIIRYINDGPSTSGFPLDSPGRAGVWIGWQIVRKYMKDYPEITLPQLMADHNFQQILNASGYNPE